MVKCIIFCYHFFCIGSFLPFSCTEKPGGLQSTTPQYFCPGFHLVVRMVGDECSYTESDFLEIGKMISVSLYTKVTTKYLPDS